MLNHKIVESPLVGKILIATRAIPAGSIIFQESPLCLVSPCKPDDESITFQNASNIAGKIWARYLSFRQLPIETKKQILEFYSPVTSQMAIDIRAALESFVDNSAYVYLSRKYDINIEEFVQLSMVYRYNGASVNPQPLSGDSSKPQSLGTGLFLSACRMNHSCNPNSSWLSTANGDRVVRTLQDLEENEEITIDYRNEEDALQPTFIRQRILHDNWGFDCNCSTCQEEGDVRRQFNCCTGPACLHGRHLVCQLTSSHTPYLLPCNTCAATASVEYSEGTLAREMQLLASITKLNGQLDNRELTSISLADIAAMDPNILCSTHYLAASVHRIQYEMAIGKYSPAYISPPKSLMAMLAVVEGFKRFLGERSSKALAFAYERLGDAWYHNGSAFIEATKCYQRALLMLRIVSGRDTPYCKFVMESLKRAHKKCLVAMVTPTRGTICGFCGDDRPSKLLLCGKCGKQGYCDRECQVAHYGAHKILCASIC